MSVLIIAANPESNSLTMAVAAAIADGARAADEPATVADLATEGFDPRFTPADRAAYLGTGPVPEDVRREQRRVDEAAALALVFPVYWWSMPALLKGWVDRVFTRDWAYAYTAEGQLEGRLRDRPVHVVGLASGDAEGYDRHGHAAAIETQITRGIFGYCGITSVTTSLLHGVEGGEAGHLATYLEQARLIGKTLATAGRATTYAA